VEHRVSARRFGVVSPPLFHVEHQDFHRSFRKQAKEAIQATSLYLIANVRVRW
jgi:hypothetical protein